ncbi:hypothetical protein [Sphingomonas albertensis]|uniref:Glycosyltransferase RgtA/B/C/D-like domain-containing protein n=1 Tax=Sphingomonas albertensis TaxID=2762591 RepID=A0ABR7AQH4_9SPHN|nr:hypothetical protein [Sphingomonas albertensis]MBC3942202.1 hypothetical protein [Sphingomonas albertensis]
MPSAPPPTPVSPDVPTGIPRSILALLAAFAAFAFTIIVPTALRDGDTGWHLATGAWIVAHASVPTTDPFSFTATGRPWVAHEWLSELAMYASYRAAGWSGLIVLIGAAMAALFALVAYEIRRWLSTRASILALLLLVTGLLPSLLARPHILALPMLAGWLIALLHARARDRPPALGFALLMLVWANAHGSFVFGLALVGVFALEALITAAPSHRRRVVLGWGAFGLACAIAATATPAGFDGLVFPFYVDRLKLLAHLDEWQPADFATFSGFEAILLATLACLLLRPVRIPPVRLLLLLGVLHLALQHTRQEIVLVVVGILVLAEPLGKAWTTNTRSSSIPCRESRSIGILILLLAIGLATYRIAVPVVRNDSAGIPATALRQLPPALRNQRVFNEYSFGGSLILAGIRPYIDGRSDMYGDPFTLDYFRIAAGDAERWHAANARWHFGWTILPPRSPLVGLLDHDPAWRRVYTDGTAVIHQPVPAHRPTP